MLIGVICDLSMNDQQSTINLQACRAYAVAHLRNVNMGPPIEEYLQRIDATLEPFGGRFLIHGGELEGTGGDLAEAPDRHRIPRPGSRARGMNRLRISRSCRCARTTPRAMLSSSMA